MFYPDLGKVDSVLLIEADNIENKTRPPAGYCNHYSAGYGGGAGNRGNNLKHPENDANALLFLHKRRGRFVTEILIINLKT